MAVSAEDRVLELVATFRAFAATTTDLDSLVATVARELARLVGDACIVSRAKDDGTWREPFSSAAHSEEHAAVLRDALASTKDTSSDSARTLRLGHPILIPHLRTEQLASRVDPSYAEAVRALGGRSFLSMPMMAEGKCVGVVSLFRYLPESVPFGDHDRAFVSIVCDHASLAIANALLVKRAKTFVALVENATDMIATADFQGRVLSMNRAGRALVGIPDDADIRKTTLADFHTPDGLKRGPIIRETGKWEGEGVLRHQVTGELIATRISSFLVREPDGEKLCYATVQHDLRETKRLEGELRQAQKMEALGRLAGGVAHDFNNLLTVILSYCTLALNALPAEGRTARDITQIDRAARRAAELTKQLLAFSRRQMVEPQVVDLGAAVAQMESMIQRLVGEDIELRMRAREGDGVVLVDAGSIEQVVMNLVVNARDAMEAGGVLTVETTRSGSFVVLTIADTGMGIDDTTKAHLFEPFFTTKERGKGTGLGLSTVMGIVEQSGGHVQVESEVGVGATFKVYVPVTTQLAVGTAELAPVTSEPTYIGRRRILVVEDEPEVRALIGEVLRDAGFDVVDAPDGEAALGEVSAPGDIHLLLTDVIMPRMSGPDLAAHFLRARPDGRVLYMSGYTDDKLGSRLAKDVELVPKPLTPELLLRRVRAILA